MIKYLAEIMEKNPGLVINISYNINFHGVRLDFFIGQYHKKVIFLIDELSYILESDANNNYLDDIFKATIQKSINEIKEAGMNDNKEV